MRDPGGCLEASGATGGAIEGAAAGAATGATVTTGGTTGGTAGGTAGETTEGLGAGGTGRAETSARRSSISISRIFSSSRWCWARTTCGSETPCFFSPASRAWRADW